MTDFGSLDLEWWGIIGTAGVVAILCIVASTPWARPHRSVVLGLALGVAFSLPLTMLTKTQKELDDVELQKNAPASADQTRHLHDEEMATISEYKSAVNAVFEASAESNLQTATGQRRLENAIRRLIQADASVSRFTGEDVSTRSVDAEILQLRLNAMLAKNRTASADMRRLSQMADAVERQARGSARAVDLATTNKEEFPQANVVIPPTIIPVVPAPIIVPPVNQLPPPVVVNTPPPPVAF